MNIINITFKMLSMQQQLQQLQEERAKPVVTDQQAIMAQVRREMAFEKAKMMAEVEQAMKEKEDALVEKITAKLHGNLILVELYSHRFKQRIQSTKNRGCTYSGLS